jgi:hypothetical protein
MYEGNSFTAAAAVDPEIGYVNGDHGKLRIQFTHPDQAQVREVRPPIRITRGQFLNPLDVVVKVEVHADQALLDHSHNQPDATQVKSGLSQHRFAGQQRFIDPLRNFERPRVVGVSPVGESNQ